MQGGGGVVIVNSCPFVLDVCVVFKGRARTHQVFFKFSPPISIPVFLFFFGFEGFLDIRKRSNALGKQGKKKSVFFFFQKKKNQNSAADTVAKFCVASCVAFVPSPPIYPSLASLEVIHCIKREKFF